MVLFDEIQIECYISRQGSVQRKVQSLEYSKTEAYIKSVREPQKTTKHQKHIFQLFLCWCLLSALARACPYDPPLLSI